jgi:pimeloyl-ACP methyl ester carboxylesterase
VITIEGSEGVPLVFLHGWPDGPDLWDDLVRRFLPRRCVRVQLPAFPGSHARTGADFPDLVDTLEAELEQALGGQPVVFVGHDWGAVITYLFAVRHPDRLERVVTLDVGGHLAVSARDAPVFLGYQAWLIGAEALGRAFPRIGDAMARWMARQAGAPRPERIEARAGYPYRYAWRAMLRPRYRKSFVRRFEPRHPHLFLYGANKPFPFHSDAWEATLARRDDCEVLAVARADHWLMLRQPEVVYAAIAAFVEA